MLSRPPTVLLPATQPCTWLMPACSRSKHAACCPSKLPSTVCRVDRQRLWEAIQPDVPESLLAHREVLIDRLVGFIEHELTDRNGDATSGHQQSARQRQQQQQAPQSVPRQQQQQQPQAPEYVPQKQHQQQSQTRQCWLAGVGPGSKEHLTLIQQADVVVYDDLGTQDLLDEAPAGAELVYVGKRGGQPSIKQPDIDKLLVQLCQQGKRVVRLKGGCPSTFSRVSSEAAALSKAGISYQLVPGLSTATAAAVLAGFPLTDARLAGSYAVVSAHDAAKVDWLAFRAIPTLVILMGGRGLSVIVQELQATGWPHSTPVAVVKEAGVAGQQVWFSCLSEVQEATATGAPLSPCVIIVGQVAALPAVWHQ